MEIWPIEPHPVQRKITQPAGLVSRDLEETVVGRALWLGPGRGDLGPLGYLGCLPRLTPGLGDGASNGLYSESPLTPRLTSLSVFLANIVNL